MNFPFELIWRARLKSSSIDCGLQLSSVAGFFKIEISSETTLHFSRSDIVLTISDSDMINVGHGFLLLNKCGSSVRKRFLTSILLTGQLLWLLCYCHFSRRLRAWTEGVRYLAELRPELMCDSYIAGVLQPQPKGIWGCGCESAYQSV